MRRRTRWRRGVLSRTLGVALLLGAFLLAACGGVAGEREVSQVVDGTPVLPNARPAAGKAAIQQYGCGACHTIPGVPGANGSVGPPLTAFAKRDYIAGVLTNTPENVVAWILNPQAFVPNNGMPVIGVRVEDARDMAAYLETLD